MNPIKDARIRYGLTQHQLAELTGIPHRTIQNWEGGQRKCPDYVEKLILEKLDMLHREDHREQGTWKKRGNERTCSVCEFIYYSNNDDWNFCPNCGSKMYK